MHDIAINEALQELQVNLPWLTIQSKKIQLLERKPGISCRRLWNPAAKTYTYHTHAVVPGIGPAALHQLSHLFFNAYSLQQHGWYSQFVSGVMAPLPFAAGISGEHQLGQGYFDFGVGGLRRYHLLFSKIIIDRNSHAVVLRSVRENMPVLKPSKQVYILPPTGDVFSMDEAGLHWHHICTTSGVRLLPGVLDRWLMNALRATGLDSKERKTYTTEAEAFTRFVKTL